MTLLHMIAGSLAVVTVLLAGLLMLCWMSPPPMFRSLWARLALAHLVGAGVVTWIPVATSLVLHRLAIWPVYALVIVGGAARWRQMRAYLTFRDPDIAVEEASPAPLPLNLLLGAIILLGILLAASGWTRHLLEDAYTIWAIKGKVLFYDGRLSSLVGLQMPPVFPPHGPSYFTDMQYCNHVNYPLLVPLQFWWGYRHLGGVSDAWLRTTDLLFYLDLLVLVYAVCRATTRVRYALTGMAVVAGQYFIGFTALGGMADVILAAYFLASAACLGYYVTQRDLRLRLPLLGLLVATLQVKNEGTTWVALALAILVWFEIKQSRPRSLGSVALVTGSHIPWTLYRIHWHLRQGPEEPMLPLRMLVRELPTRLAIVLSRYLIHLSPLTWGPYLLLIPLGVVQTLLRDVKLNRPMFLLVLGQLLTYTAIFVSVADVEYELSAFLARAMSHLSPTVVVACVMGCFGRVDGSDTGHIASEC